MKKHEKTHKIYTKVKNVKKVKNHLLNTLISENQFSKLKKHEKAQKS